jgi:hypothetical protein
VCLKAVIAKMLTYNIFTNKGKYIKDILRYQIPLSIKKKALTFLIIKNYVDIEELLWLNNYYNYVYEGSRVDYNALLKMYCYIFIKL